MSDGNMPTSEKPLFGFDTETYLIDQTAQLPKIVCCSFASSDNRGVAVNADPNDLRGTVEDIIADRTSIKVGQSVAFDLGVFATNYPDLLPAIFEALDAEQFSCTLIREKLLNLTRHGHIDIMRNPDGSTSQLKYNMETLALKYLGLDLSAEKNDEDAFRKNFAIFDNVPLEQWPAKAVAYVKDDASIPVKIWLLQEEQRRQMIATRGIDPFLTESFRVLVDFVLKLVGSEGVATDPEAVAKVEKMLAEALAPEKMDLIIKAGILRPATVGKELKIKAHVKGCDKKKGCNCPNKIGAPVKESVNKTALVDYVKAFAERMNTDPCPVCGGSASTESRSVPGVFEGCKNCRASGRVPKAGLAEPAVKLAYTDPSDKFPDGQVSVTSDWLAEYAHLDPVLAQYKARQELQKLVTTEIPRMKLYGVLQPVVFPQFDILKETGRISSYGHRATKDKPATAATFNCTNVDPRVRGCYVPRPGRLMWSCDLSQMELGTLAQTCYKLFGYSVLRDKINARVDVHAYTGAQLAFAMDTEFQKFCVAIHGNPTPDQIATEFLAMKKEAEASDEFKFYKHWRKFAKPVNLGYPGGLGPKTFVAYAAGEPYGVKVTEDEASTLRDLWKQTYPEMKDYFEYINHQCVDPYNKGWDEETKEEYDLYAYDSPFGMHRAGCDYCACANGMGLQTPSAEGALMGLAEVVKACYTGKDRLFAPVNGRRPVQPLMFIHDEIVGEIDDDLTLAHERLMEVRAIMVAAMRVVTPDVRADANPCLMRRWNKFAEPVYVDGRLGVWEEPLKETT